MRVSAALSLAMLVGSVVAAPTPGLGTWLKEKGAKVQEKVKEVMTSGKISGHISAEDLANITYYAEYAAASYCLPTTPTISCLDNICPTLQSATITKTLEWADGRLDSTGFLAVDHNRKEIIITYRGSKSLENWVSNLLVDHKNVDPWCKGCEVHQGFLSSYLEQPGIYKEVVKTAAEFPEYKIKAVGHSLGGALATLMAVDLRATRGLEVDLYSYGAPRVGNREFAEYATKSGKNFRVTHREDPVPRLPPSKMGYEHVSPEYHIFKKDTDIKPEDVNVVEGIDNDAGNGAGIMGVDIGMHRSYILPVKSISGCGRREDEKHSLPAWMGTM